MQKATIARTTISTMFLVCAAAWAPAALAEEAHGVGFKIVSGVTDSAGAHYCMDASLDSGAQNTNFERVYVYKCHGRENQRFTLTDNDNGTTAAIIGHAGKCLDVRGAQSRDDTRVQLWRCHFRANQEFEYRAGGVIKDSHSNKCLAIAGAADRQGITLEDCDGRASEVWRLER